MRHITVGNLPEHSFAVEEALNRLQINFSFCGDSYKKVLVTSALPGEGKSFITFRLWLALAGAKKKTLLIDADLRKSAMHTQYRLMPSGTDTRILGLSHFLAGQAKPDDVVYSTNISNAYLLPAAMIVTNPSILLQNQRFADILDMLSAHFDYILIDSPPLGSVADGALIASHCNGGVLVVRSGATPRGLISNSLKQLKHAECPLIGVVLNRIETKSSPYYHKYPEKRYYNV